jgi:Ca2+-binding EF-hand superfamily protein
MTAALSEAELQRLRATFDDFDKDGSGELDLSELREVLRAFLGPKVTERKILRIFKAADTDKSGAIDFQEFVDAMQRIRLDEYQEQKAIFDMLDLDHSGTLESNEFKQACQSLGLTLTDVEIDLLFETYDTNGDRVIDFEEFCQMLKSLR